MAKRKVEGNKDHCFWSNFRDKNNGCKQEDLFTCCGFCKDKACEDRCREDPNLCRYCCTIDDLVKEQTVVIVEEPKEKRKYVKKEFKVSEAEVLKRQKEKENVLKGENKNEGI